MTDRAIFSRLFTLTIPLALLWLALGYSSAAAGTETYISLACNAQLRKDPALSRTLADVAELLRQTFPGKIVAFDAPKARIRIDLVISPDLSAAPDGFFPWPSAQEQGYRWRARPQGHGYALVLEAPSAVALSHGLYGLLQEKLAIRFIHPRQTLIPRYSTWPLAAKFTLEAKPRFARRGFHLHTLHPIELTEALLDPSLEGGAEAVREYIDWLARNGQNLMQFYLLRDLDRKTWIPHMQALAWYARERGIRFGCMLSVAMLQQKAFQLVKLMRPISYRQQISSTLDWIDQVPWDFITVEFTLGEHLPDLREVGNDLEEIVVEELNRRGMASMIATHVIRHGEPATMPNVPGDANELSGVLVHTVMCYSVSEPSAPVYGNRNLHFMARRAYEENQQRETWFWPESAYWVAFDNSIPLLLLPYLDSRQQDVAFMEEIGIPGHLTFSSGWEWGYWLTDWSIARWSWAMGGSEEEQINPMQYMNEIFTDPADQKIWRQALASQNTYLKEDNLLPLLTAADPFSEMIPPFNANFQPRSELSCRNMLTETPKEDIAPVIEQRSQSLNAFAAEQQAAVSALSEGLRRKLQVEPLNVEETLVRLELIRALEVTALRAQHRATVLQAALARRLHGSLFNPLPHEANGLLQQAAALRHKAQLLVVEQEQNYRYPPSWLIGQRPDHTAYHFGYLYPVSQLFFWKREEEQIREGRCDALFMKLWNFRRTLGLESLLF